LFWERTEVPLLSTTQTRALTSSARRTGSPWGTMITLVAHPLLMPINAIKEMFFKLILFLGILADGVLARQALKPF